MLYLGKALLQPRYYIINHGISASDSACNIFEKETGKTYSQFLNEIRIEKSKKLLLDTNLSVLKLTLSVGYNNQNYYNMTFKKLAATMPLKHRNSCPLSLD